MASFPFDCSGAVLLPIDMQRAIDWPGRPRRGNPALDENGLRLLASWREKGLPIIHVRHDSVEAESLFRSDHPGNAPRPGFEPRAERPKSGTQRTPWAALVGDSIKVSDVVKRRAAYKLAKAAAQAATRREQTRC